MFGPGITANFHRVSCVKRTGRDDEWRGSGFFLQPTNWQASIQPVQLQCLEGATDDRMVCQGGGVGVQLGSLAAADTDPYKEKFHARIDRA